MFEVFNISFLITKDLKILFPEIELNGTLNQIETDLLRNGDHTFLNENLIYPIIAISISFAYNYETGKVEILERGFMPIANEMIIKLLTTIL